jgi:hypothetical protein
MALRVVAEVRLELTLVLGFDLSAPSGSCIPPSLLIRRQPSFTKVSCSSLMCFSYTPRGEVLYFVAIASAVPMAWPIAQHGRMTRVPPNAMGVGTEAANDIGAKQIYSTAACRVAMGTYPTSNPGGGVTIKAGSISASFPTAGGSR